MQRIRRERKTAEPRPPVREGLLAAAKKLFAEKGFDGVSVKELAEATGHNAALVNYYFKSKEGLIHEVLQHSLKTMREGTADIPSSIRSWPELENWFNAHIEFQKASGMARACLFGTIANEITETDEATRRHLESIFDLMEERLATFFAEEKANRRLAADANERVLANFCIATVQGAMLLAKVRRDSATAERIVREALSDLRYFIT